MQGKEPKNKKIIKIEDSYDNTEYFLEMFKEGDHIHFRIKESKLRSSLTFENDYTMEDFIKANKVFNSCDDLDEILNNLYSIYNNKKVELMSAGTSEEKYLFFDIWCISEYTQIKLILKKS